MSDSTSAIRLPSLVKKYLMAGTGLVLVLFVLGHLVGNLQIFSGDPETINRYAHFLQSLGIWLWVIRLFLLACVGVHIWMAVLLTLENRRARPRGYAIETAREASFAARTMRWSGFILLAFILFHLAQFTIMSVYPIYASLAYPLEGEVSHDVYAMMILGFTSPVIAGFYLVAMALLCLHLAHGASSMFQSVGLRNEKWRRRLNHAAKAYGLLIFLGFASIPAAVQLSLLSETQFLPARAIVTQAVAAQETWDPGSPAPVFVDYNQALNLRNERYNPHGAATGGF